MQRRLRRKPHTTIALIVLLAMCWLAIPACEQPQAQKADTAAGRADTTSAATPHMHKPKPEPWPHRVLLSGDLGMKVYLPDWEKGFYRGLRFDHSGMIKRVWYSGHKWYGSFHDKSNPDRHDNVVGPAEEFGLESPVGFDEAAEGEPFVKIGVGILKKVPHDTKKSVDYKFFRKYPIIERGEWKITSGKDWIQFRQQLSHEEWGYDYTKRIQLDADQPGFIIMHGLKNTGRKAMKTRHYCHNFTIVDDVPIGPDYVVELPFTAPEPQDVKNGTFEDNTIRPAGPLAEKSIWAILEGWQPIADHNAFVVRNTKTGVGLAYNGDEPIVDYRVYAVPSAMCPEPFIAIDLDPGESMDWVSTYRLITPETD
ncbi:MAG: hypothetical protein GVY16_10240 [Planctomycetes bacterium]|jgi:hypothetical protein|nr:hypothetical protein [Planctomycetota bacterium]